MDIHLYLHKPELKYLPVDLDSREPLTKVEAAALDAAIKRLVENRAELNESIRKITQRLILSAEAAVKEARNDG